MSLTFYNTLTRTKEEFESLNQNRVSLYHCGPTVYDRAHIGNFRAFFFADILRRALERRGYSVKQVMNITDVDDKTIKGSRESGEALSEFTQKHEKEFLEDLEKMNIKRPAITPRATEYIDEMIRLISVLMEKGLAYKADDGVYFDISKSTDYGKLAQIENRTKSRERISNDEYDKENAHDFALWKFHSEEDGGVFWEAPFGKGRPGWHIECSAMSMKNLGETIDIHTGGLDLVFPHHTNEIAQSEGVTGKKFVKIWLHSGFVNVNGKKMSKSLGNTYPISYLEKEGINPLAYRYLLLTSHYRTLMNFTWDSVHSAQTAWLKMREVASSLPEDGDIDLAYKAEFESFLDDDLDTPKALALAWKLINDNEIKPENKKMTLLSFNEIFGLKLEEKIKFDPIPDEINKIAEEREMARQNKDWKKADEIRKEISKLGYEVSDTDGGPLVRKTRSR